MLTIKEQLQRAVEKLEERGIVYALAGGVAASIYGEERLTKNVDFVIGGKDKLSAIGKAILEELDLKASVVRQADLDGGPLFAIKRKNTEEMIIIGRDPQKQDPGVDFLLPTNRWAPQALSRAQQNAIDFEFRKIPTLTVEDVVICKMLSGHKEDREQDIIDLRNIFRGNHDLDFSYVTARMKEFGATVPKNVEKDTPSEILDLSQRIARDQKRTTGKSGR